MNGPIRLDGVYRFGRFRLDAARRRLECNGTPVNLTARLYNTLIYLVAHRDRVIARDELQAALWPSRTVEENNLIQAIYALRKALQPEGSDEQLIATFPGRGYQFALPVEFEPPPADGHADQGAAQPDTVTSSAPIRSAAPRTWRRVLAGGLAILCMACAVFFATGQWRPASWHAAPEPGGTLGDVSPHVPPPHSVAVLPFTNLAGDAGQDYFSDGLAEELIAALGRLVSLEVAAPSSSFMFKGKAASVRDIGRALNVRAVLEGSVRRDAGRLRVTARLTDAATGYLLWAHSYDCDQSGVFTLQQQIAEAVAAAVQITLLADDGVRLSLGGTTDPAALDAYLRGMKLRNQHSRDGIRAALAAFAQAIAIDPHYTLAHVQHADILILGAEGYVGDTADPAHLRDMQSAALAEARAAVAASPGLGEAHAVLALADAEFWEFARESGELARARALAPSNSRILMSYARFQVDIGQNAAAAAAAARATALDPLAPDIYADMAAVLLLARRPDDALVALRHAEQLGFDGAPDTDLRAHVHLMQGDDAGAARMCAGAQDWFQRVCQAIADHGIGREDAAAAAMESLRGDLGDTGAYEYARIYAAWGQTEAALHWLEVAYSLHDDGLIDMGADSFLDRLRGNAHFKDIQARLRFPAALDVVKQ
jgi:serine/threonine-protein kinase